MEKVKTIPELKGTLTVIEEITDVKQLQDMYKKANEAHDEAMKNAAELAKSKDDKRELFDKLFEMSSIPHDIRNAKQAIQFLITRLNKLENAERQRTSQIADMLNRLDKLERPDVFND